ncbi:hypothetical protein F8388_005645 [Cannabis sativa]|uniref:Uncharacterized protein n=1 Tax=Cannabis sativa TaxID=3483 RepID=A0A7J6GB33_CANSA|nr:hypothetical protein F8388_005645 [Cannabis sativa]KAF4380155.1 hypothetical protein G4B88_011229 [Cannabis sativa]
MTMEELGLGWSLYQEASQQNISALNYKLQRTKVELESVKMEAKAQMEKNEEYLRSLLDFLKTALKERDEARNQLQKVQFMFCLPQTENPILMPSAKANSSITESNSLSETYNHHSHGSSPVESFFDAAAVSSPEFSNINMDDSSQMGFSMSSVPAPLNIDPASVVIENLSKGKPLPEKGKLLQAVLGAGTLLHNLLLAGPLPSWRNPPPLQPFKIPPVSIKCTGEGSSGYNQKPVDNSHVPQKAVQYSQSCSASMLNFSGGTSSSSLNNSTVLSMSSSYNDQIPIGKRQRLH